MKTVKIDRPRGKDLIFEGEQIARMSNQVSGIMVLWRTKGGKYVLESTIGKEKKVQIYNSPKEASSLILDTYTSVGKKLIKAAQSRDKAFQGLTEERIE